MKSCAKFDLICTEIWFVIRKYLMCNCMFTWKKWILKFKLLYLLNHVSYFNKIRNICLKYKVWKFGSNPYYHGWITAFLSGDCFLLMHPVAAILQTKLCTLVAVHLQLTNNTLTYVFGIFGSFVFVVHFLHDMLVNTETQKSFVHHSYTKRI